MWQTLVAATIQYLRGFEKFVESLNIMAHAIASTSDVSDVPVCGSRHDHDTHEIAKLVTTLGSSGMYLSD